jgi:very-short-patch-repair endonuclease
MNLKEFSRQLRNHSTLGEILLWKKLRAGSIMCYSFNRQKPLGRYIVDFYCKPLNLVIEVDGGYHNEPMQVIKDKERQQILESMNLNFLRFSDQQVRKDMEMVIKAIQNYILNYEEKHPEVKAATKRYG